MGKVLPSTRCPATWRLQMSKWGIQRESLTRPTVTRPHVADLGSVLLGPPSELKPVLLPSATLQAEGFWPCFQNPNKGWSRRHSCLPQGLQDCREQAFPRIQEFIPVTSLPTHTSAYTYSHSCHDYNTSHHRKFCKSWRFGHYEAQVSSVN